MTLHVCEPVSNVAYPGAAVVRTRQATEVVPVNVTMSNRRTGGGYALALKTSQATHCTLVYFNSCRRGFEQDLVKSMAAEYFAAHGLTQVELQLGEVYAERSLLVRCEALERAVFDLRTTVFASFDIDRGGVPLHIDLRGSSAAEIDTTVSVVDNWYI